MKAIMTSNAGLGRTSTKSRGEQMQAIEGVREVRDNLAEALDKSIADRPYTTLILGVAIGFLLGVYWSR